MERYGRRKEGALRSAFHRECIELKGKNILFRISRRREVVVKLTDRWQSAPSRFSTARWRSRRQKHKLTPFCFILPSRESFEVAG